MKRGQLTHAAGERRGAARSPATVPEELMRTSKSRSSSQTKGSSSFLKCLKKRQAQRAAAIFKRVSHLLENGTKSIKQPPRPRGQAQTHTPAPEEKPRFTGLPLPQVSIKNPLLRSAHRQPTSHLV